MWTTMRAAIVVVTCFVGCATAPETRSGRDDLETSARATLRQMIDRDPSIRQVLNTAPGYVVFPKIGEGGAIIGGAFGQGILFENGRRVGFVKVEQAAVGALLGGKSYAELLVLRDRDMLADIKDGEFEMTANADVVVLTAGVAASATFKDSVVAFVMPIGGLMANVSVAGQRFKFVPAG